MLPPIATNLLEGLGVWDAFRRGGHREIAGTAAAWGTPSPRDNPYLFGNSRDGWHLDRGRFDAMLAAEAERKGVQLDRLVRIVQADREGRGWRLRLSDRSTRTARFVLDATGRRAAFARGQGARARTVDRLVAFAG